MRREIDSRSTSTGEQVAVYWDDETGALALEIVELDGVPRWASIEPGEALDALWHPYVYIDRHPLAA